MAWPRFPRRSTSQQNSSDFIGQARSTQHYTIDLGKRKLRAPRWKTRWKTTEQPSRTLGHVGRQWWEISCETSWTHCQVRAANLTLVQNYLGNKNPFPCSAMQTGFFPSNASLICPCCCQDTLEKTVTEAARTKGIQRTTTLWAQSLLSHLLSAHFWHVQMFAKFKLSQQQLWASNAYVAFLYKISPYACKRYIHIYIYI